MVDSVTSVSGDAIFSGAGSASDGSPREVLSAEEASHAAQEYIQQGWAVWAGPGLGVDGICACRAKGRCRNPGKHAHKGWGNGERKSLSAEQAERYWSEKNKLWLEKPVDQVFILPYLSGLIVADVDNMDKWMELDPDQRPETLWQKSGSGRGGHFLYRFEWDTSEVTPPRVRGKLLNGAGEVKFRGIIAAAPSVHTDGGRYGWVNWGTEVAPAPKWMIEEPVKRDKLDADWDTIVGADLSDPSNFWMQQLFFSDYGAIQDFAEVKTSRPTVMVAIAASMAKWIASGVISREKVVDELLQASEYNGAMEDYGAVELTRQINNGIDLGMLESRE